MNMVEMVTLPNKTINYCFVRGKKPRSAIALLGTRTPSYTKYLNNNEYGGDGGTRTHVQNGLKQTSTGVASYYLG